MEASVTELAAAHRRKILVILLALVLLTVAAGRAEGICVLPDQAAHCSPPDNAPFPTIQ